MQNWLIGRSNATWGMQSKVRTGLTLCGLAILFLMLSTVSAVAQLSGKGQITGVVTDKTGAVIPGADVTATSTATGIKTAGKTNGAGIYTFSALDPGIFTLEVSAQGFESLKQENIHVNAMESVGYNPALDVAGAAPVEITVTGEPPQLETSNATLGSTMEQESYSELPVEMGAYGNADQRRATDFAFLMPGVQGNNTNGNATTNVGIVNGSGSKGAASDVYIDGIPFVRAGGNGDPRFVWSAISVDAIDQFQVQTNGYSAIYEGQGVMNYSVKGGGNQYHGSGYEFIRNTALDTWGFWGKAPTTVNNVQVVQKPVEHSNEYGINLSGPLVPYGKLKDKLFFFENYNGFRYTATVPTAMTFPTYAQQAGNFTDPGLPTIYDPAKVYTTKTSAGNTVNCRNQFNSSSTSCSTTTSTANNYIPSTRFSAVSKALQANLPTTGIGTALQNNFLSQNASYLNNWSTTSRIDYNPSAQDTFSVIGAIGRQASGVPQGQNTSGRGVGPVPYNYGQAFAPKTAVWTLEETHTFNSNLLNQIKWGYARYNGPTFTPDYSKTYAASTEGITFGNAPAGQAPNAFPIVTFGGTDAPTQWGGTTANVTIAQNYTVLDNLQWNHGKHSITFGGQIAWLLYNTVSATGGSTPITLKTANTETAQFQLTGSSANTSTSTYTMNSATGYSYASFLLGQFDGVSFTDYNYHPGYGARFRAISPYVQDDWKVSSKLTVNAGLRYDFYPSVREVNDDASFFNPNLANSATGMNGALQFAGYGANTCNCHSPVNNFYKNFGPRVGAAYQLDSKTVIRASYGLMFSHGDAVGGLAYSMGTLGFAAAPSYSSSKSVTNSSLGFLYNSTGTSIPTYTTAAGAASGATYGTGYTTTTGYTGTPSSMGYVDPYLGGRAPEYVNWNFGVQRQLTNAISLNVAYVGSQGHFLQMDGSNARGYWADQLDPKYLALNSTLSTTASSTTSWASICSANNLTCPAASAFTLSQSLGTLLKPFPFQSVGDSFGYVGNANYNALQAVASLRNWKGLTGNVSYTLSRSIDDAGYFRAGYAIPTTYIYNATGGSYISNQKIERTVSSSNQPQHLVVTAVYKEPLGKTYLASNRYERMLLGGYTVSGIFQAFSGSPLAVTMSTCNSNPAQSSSFCPASYNSNYAGNPRINGKWGKGVTAASYSTSFIDSSAFVKTPDYMFGNLPRMAPYNLYGPGNYQLDLSASRSFPLHVLAGSKLDFKAQWYNVTNHTQFAVASTALGSSSFGQVTTNSSANRKAAQFTARISF
jgi:hypothetical protein